jgi:hypothetical protein
MKDGNTTNKRALSGSNDIDGSRNVRPIANSSNPQMPLSNIPEGLCFISFMNKRKRFFLPSTKNYFGDIKVSRVLTDTGCTSLLLPLESTGQLFRLLESHHEICDFIISFSRNAGGQSPVLLFQPKSVTLKFSVHVCTDIMPGDIKPEVDNLRFSLCAEDVDEINGGSRRFFIDAEVKKLEGVVVTSKRREHALLGQSILYNFYVMKYRKIELYVDPVKFVLPSTFDELNNMTSSIESQLQPLKPDDFDDWEDNDNAYEDDEYVEDE